ncbi:hypothetical protein AVEN_21539-1, partial [Araneus ventricosus]
MVGYPFRQLLSITQVRTYSTNPDGGHYTNEHFRAKTEQKKNSNSPHRNK